MIALNQKVDDFVRLICGSDFDDSAEIDQILEHISNSLKRIVDEIHSHAADDSKLQLYAPYLGRAILELSVTALVARLDPFKVLLMKRKQEQHDYELGKPHSSALRWQGDVTDKAVNKMWEDKELKEPTRALLGDYQVELSLKTSAQHIFDNGDAAQMGDWHSTLTQSDYSGLMTRLRSDISRLFSSLSKGVHHEFLVPLDSLFDRDTVVNLINDTIFVVATLGLLVSQTPHAYKSAELNTVSEYYRNAKELELEADGA